MADLGGFSFDLGGYNPFGDFFKGLFGTDKAAAQAQVNISQAMTDAQKEVAEQQITATQAVTEKKIEAFKLVGILVISAAAIIALFKSLF